MPGADTFEAIIIGAGPGGAVLAALLARSGRSVCVLERAAFPRDRVGESITWDCAQRLSALRLPSPAASSPAPWRIGAMRVSYEGGGSYRARFPEQLRHYLIRRAPFDAAMLSRARSEGAELVEEGARRLLTERGRAVGVELESGRRLYASRVVAAAVGRDVGLLRGAVEYGRDPRLSIFGGRAFFRLPWRIPKDEVELYVAARDIAVVTPLDDGALAAVFFLLGEPAKAAAGGRAEAFLGLLARFPSLASKLRGAEREGSVEFQAHMATRAESISVGGLALLGNALGYSDPLLSHGVDYAVTHAERLAGVLAGGDLDRGLARYHAAGRRLIAADVALHRIAYEVLWREGVYRRVLPDGAEVSGVRLGERALGWLWRLAGHLPTGR